eukprot:ANDGO_08545.mRNA.1 Cholesterol 25-hydroxylase-like protein
MSHVVALAQSPFEPIWQMFLRSEKLIGNDILFGVAIQQFFHVSYIIVSSIWTYLYIYHNYKHGAHRPAALRLNFILKWLAINTLVLISVAALPPALGLKAEWPVHAPSVSTFLYQLFWILVWYDVFFWTFHYAFHRIPWFYKNIHSVHHQCNPVVAVHSQVMHPLEMLLLTFPAIVPGVALGYHPFSYFFFQMCLVVYGSFVHGHFDYNVEKYTLGIMAGSISHGRHHTACDTNYGGFTSIMDRLMGTYTFDKHVRNNSPLDFAFRAIDSMLGRQEDPRLDRAAAMFLAEEKKNFELQQQAEKKTKKVE